MPRILVGICTQEVSSFNPVPSRYADFHISRGAELLERHRGTSSELGGALSVFDADPSVEVIPAYGAQANTSGGTLGAADFARISGEFLDAIRAAPPVDAVYFTLHGAMSAEGEPDPEGYLLEQTRAILGEEIPIVVSMDLHGILTDRILTHADVVTVYHTYPHVDFRETGERAGRALLRILNEGAKPVTASVRVPALVRGDELITETGRIRHVVQAAQAVENGPSGLSAGMYWGNPFTDVPDLRSNSLVVLDGDPERAAQEARRIAELFWEHHEHMRVPLVSLEEAARQAKELLGQGTAIMVDAADATSSGASGDSNAIVRALLEAGYEGTILTPVVDPAVARDAIRAGVGNTFDTVVGGALDPERFTPLPLEVTVVAVSDGKIRSESFGSPWDAGDTAVLRAGKVTLVVTTRPVSLFDRALFLAHGLDARTFDAVVVKSPHCEHHMFEEWAARMIHVDAPGSTSANLPRLGHTQCARPVFPLDPDVPFTPEPRLFQRPRYR